MNEVRVPLIRDALISWQRENCSSHLEMQPAPLRGLKILDIGSGGGILSEVSFTVFYVKGKHEHDIMLGIFFNIAA